MISEKAVEKHQSLIELIWSHTPKDGPAYSILIRWDFSAVSRPHYAAGLAWLLTTDVGAAEVDGVAPLDDAGRTAGAGAAEVLAVRVGWPSSAPDNVRHLQKLISIDVNIQYTRNGLHTTQ